MKKTIDEFCEELNFNVIETFKGGYITKDIYDDYMYIINENLVISSLPFTGGYKIEDKKITYWNFGREISNKHTYEIKDDEK